MTDPEPILPPTAADLTHLRTLIDEMRKTKDADQKRIDQLETRLATAEAQLKTARENVRKTGLLDLF